MMLMMMSKTRMCLTGWPRGGHSLHAPVAELYSTTWVL